MGTAASLGKRSGRRISEAMPRLLTLPASPDREMVGGFGMGLRSHTRSCLHRPLRKGCRLAAISAAIGGTAGPGSA